MTRDQIRRFYKRHYRPERMVVSVAGNVDHAKVVRLVAHGVLARNGFLDGDGRPAAPRQATAPRKVGTGIARRPGSSSRSTSCSGCRAHPVRPAGSPSACSTPPSVADVEPALPGGPREARPGLLGLLLRQPARRRRPGRGLGRLPAEQARQVLDVVRAELAKIAQDGIDVEELTRGKGQLKGGLVLGLEDSGSRMTRLGKSELVDDELLSIDEVLARIDGVTLDDVRSLAGELFSQPEILAIVGPEREFCRVGTVERAQRACSQGGCGRVG